MLTYQERFNSKFQWQFLTRDDGDKNPEADSGWIQDEGREKLKIIFCCIFYFTTLCPLNLIFILIEQFFMSLLCHLGPTNNQFKPITSHRSFFCRNKNTQTYQ